MSRKEITCLVVVILMLGGAMLALTSVSPVVSQSGNEPAHMAPPLRGPDDYQPAPVAITTAVQPSSDGLTAVAIVGDVDDYTPTYKNDMDRAVDALENHGVTVHKFYYGDSDFTWSDILAAAEGAHFILYMGHGVYWGGSCTEPTSVGGFFLGDGEFVTPDQIRNDLGGWLAEDSVVIFSHACFSAGNSGCDSGDWPSQAEAERRVSMYAEPFVDIGMEAYFANNYYYSSQNIVNYLLADPESRKNMGEIFKSVYPFNANKFRDLSYPTAGYDLWLSGSDGDWSHAFVGIPDYVFTREAPPPELGGLPGEVAFTYNTATEQLTPSGEIITPTNLGNSEPLHWVATTASSWFTLTPTMGESPDDTLTVTPVVTSVKTLPAGQHTGAFTVTVTDPTDTLSAVQRVDVNLDIVTPRLGNVPATLGFTYFLSDTQLFPSRHTVTPTNVGSTDVLTWELSQTGTWFSISTVSGTTPVPFTITPISYTTTQEITYTGSVTVTVVTPMGTADAVQRIDLSLRASTGSVEQSFLPLVMRD